MRPAPKARHFLGILILAATSTVAGLLALCPSELTAEQINVTVNAVRAVEGDVYARDPVFGRSGLWRFQTPVWQWYLRQSYRATGLTGVHLAFASLVGPLSFVYLVGMYALLWRQCRSWSIACFVAVLSTTMITVIGGSRWGLGTAEGMTADTVYLAFVPLLIWAFLERMDRPSVLWVFLAAGLLANVHVVTGMNLTLVLAVMLLGHWQLSWRGWALALLGGLCAAGAASPFLWTYVAQRAAMVSAVSPADWAAVAGSFRQGNLAVLYPEMLRTATEVPAVIYLLALWIPAMGLMIRFDRFRVRDLHVWVWMLVAAAGVGLLLHGVSQAAGVLRGAAPPVIDLVHALRFTLLPLYVLLAESLSHLFRMRFSRGVLRVSLTVLLAVWLVPSPNLAVARHWVADTVADMTAKAEQFEGVQKRRLRRQRNAELRAVAEWLAEHSARDARIVCNRASLRLWSQRSLVACPTDLRYFYYITPDRLAEWGRLVAAQRGLSPRRGQPLDLLKVRQFARRHEAGYVVLPAGRGPETETDADRIEGLRIIRDPQQRWGKFWRLYRIEPAPEWTRRPSPASPRFTDPLTGR